MHTQFCMFAKILQVQDQILFLCAESYLLQEPKQLSLLALYRKAVFYVFIHHILIMSLAVIWYSKQNVLQPKS